MTQKNRVIRIENALPRNLQRRAVGGDSMNPGFFGNAPGCIVDRIEVPPVPRRRRTFLPGEALFDPLKKCFNISAILRGHHQPVIGQNHQVELLVRRVLRGHDRLA